MNELRSYIKAITGVEFEELPKPADAMKRLPLFIREGYRLTVAEFFNHRVVFTEPRGEELPTPSQLKKHIPKIEAAFDSPAILVFEGMSNYLWKQLISDRIAFIVPGKQIFIPFMFMDLNEQKKIRSISTESFSPSTQCVLIYHLWKESIEELNFQDIADKFKYTPRTIGRCAEELKNAGVCNIVGTKSKYMKFGKTKKEIWNTAKEYMISPVLPNRSGWIFSDPPPDKVRISGIQALSRYSNISSGNMEIFAMDTNVYNELSNIGEASFITDNVVDKQLQIWSYDPLLLSKDEFVDPYSLYMSLRDDEDERVEMELEQMMENVL